MRRGGAPSVRYTEHEFDSEFIEALREACFRYIEKQGDATLSEIAGFIQSRGFSKVNLHAEDVLSILNTLVYDGRVDTVDDEDDVEHFRPAMLVIPKQSAFTSMPCGVCPVGSLSLGMPALSRWFLVPWLRRPLRAGVQPVYAGRANIPRQLRVF